MVNMIFGCSTVIPIALIIQIIMIVETGAITNFLIPVFATAGVTEQQFTAKLFGDMEDPQ